jgi:MATE family multidrug resistance protein
MKVDSNPRIEGNLTFHKEKAKTKENKSTFISTKSKKEKKILMIKKVFNYALPSVFSNLIVFTLETINLIFAGKFKISGYDKDDVINGIGVANIFMNFGGFLFGLGIITSLETLCSQAYGRSNMKELYKWVKICNIFMTIFFALLSVLCLFSKYFIILLGQDEDIAIIGDMYIKSLIPSFLFQFYITSYTKLLNSQQIYYPILCISSICLVLHPLWCYIFFLKMEYSIIGLGIAYNITSLIMLILLYTYTIKKKLYFEVGYNEISWKDCKKFLKFGFECGILSSIDTLGFEITSFLSTYLSQAQLDANICVINIYNNIYSISIGFATTLTILIGNLMGENKPKNALRYVRLGVFMNFTLTVAISLICIFFHSYIAMIYIEDRKILKISSKLIRIVGIYIIFDALQLQLSGVIRGIGKQLIGMCIGVAIFIFIQTGVILSFLKLTNLGVYGIWFGQMMCVILASVVYFLILKFSDWDKLALEASRENEEVKIHQETNLKSDKKESFIISYTDKNFYSDTTCP